MDNGKRWQDNGDGTVTDRITNLVWLKDANAMGRMNWDEATEAAGNLKSGEAGLSDNSKAGDWRLPTETELVGLTVGVEGVLEHEMQDFIGVQPRSYWSSTAIAGYPDTVRIVFLRNGLASHEGKMRGEYVWPVRSGQ